MTLLLCAAIVLLVALCFAVLVFALFVESKKEEEFPELDLTDYSETEEEYR